MADRLRDDREQASRDSRFEDAEFAVEDGELSAAGLVLRQQAAADRRARDEQAAVLRALGYPEVADALYEPGGWPRAVSHVNRTGLRGLLLVGRLSVVGGCAPIVVLWRPVMVGRRGTTRSRTTVSMSRGLLPRRCGKVLRLNGTGRSSGHGGRRRIVGLPNRTRCGLPRVAVSRRVAGGGGCGRGLRLSLLG